MPARTVIAKVHMECDRWPLHAKCDCGGCARRVSSLGLHAERNRWNGVHHKCDTPRMYICAPRGYAINQAKPNVGLTFSWQAYWRNQGLCRLPSKNPRGVNFRLPSLLAKPGAVPLTEQNPTWVLLARGKCSGKTKGCAFHEQKPTCRPSEIACGFYFRLAGRAVVLGSGPFWRLSQKSFTALVNSSNCKQNYKFRGIKRRRKRHVGEGKRGKRWSCMGV